MNHNVNIDIDNYVVLEKVKENSAIKLYKSYIEIKELFI